MNDDLVVIYTHDYDEFNILGVIRERDKEEWLSLRKAKMNSLPEDQRQEINDRDYLYWPIEEGNGLSPLIYKVRCQQREDNSESPSTLDERDEGFIFEEESFPFTETEKIDRPSHRVEEGKDITIGYSIESLAEARNIAKRDMYEILRLREIREKERESIRLEAERRAQHMESNKDYYQDYFYEGDYYGTY